MGMGDKCALWTLGTVKGRSLLPHPPKEMNMGFSTVGSWGGWDPHLLEVLGLRLSMDLVNTCTHAGTDVCGSGHFNSASTSVSLRICV